MTVKRTSQVVVESLSTTNPNARASQVAVEALSTTNPKGRISQMVVEVLSSVAETSGQQPVMFIVT